MGAIDEKFRHEPLDEEPEPCRRLEQALDEAKVPPGPFRDAIVEGLVDEANPSTIDTIEEGLQKAAKTPSPDRQMHAFMREVGPRVQYKVENCLRGPHPLVVSARRLIFPGAPARLWECFYRGNDIAGRALLTVAPTLYGDDVFYRDEFFRGWSTDVHEMSAEPLRSVLDHCLARDVEQQLAQGGTPDEPVLRRTADFLLAWHRHLARRSYQAADAFRFRLSYDEILRDARQYVNSAHDAETLEAVLAQMEQNLKLLHRKFIETEIRYAPVDAGECFPTEWRNAPFVPDLPAERVDELIEWSLRTDIAGWISDSSPAELLSPESFASDWYASPHRRRWLNVLWRQVSDESRSTEGRFNLLRHRFGPDARCELDPSPGTGYVPETTDHLSGQLEEDGMWSCPADPEDVARWNALFADLPDQRDFPKELLPQWVQAAGHDRCDRARVEEVASKCLGLMRKRLSDNNESFTLREYQDPIHLLERQDPGKLLRLLLLAHRACAEPGSGADLVPPQRNSPSEWDDDDMPAPEAIVRLLLRLTRDHHFDATVPLAEFCLSRIRLRKGQKPQQGGYVHEQCIDPDPVWRQGYLKVLAELSLDLGGEVHRTAFFVRKNDPDDDVRRIAAEAYKAVRRGKPAGRSASPVRRAIAATWWLRLAQREALGKEIDHEAARRTRRRELRNIR